MAGVKETQFKDRSSENAFHIQETVRFLRSKKLDPVSLIMLDMMIPFQRQISAFLSIASPFATLLIGQEKADKIISFSRCEDSFAALKDALERGAE